MEVVHPICKIHFLLFLANTLSALMVVFLYLNLELSFVEDNFLIVGLPILTICHVPYVPKKMTTGLSGLITFENEYENKCGLGRQIYNYSSIFGENFMRFA